MVDSGLWESESLWKFAVAGSGAAVWDWDIQTGTTRYSENWKKIFGYTDPESLFKGDAWINYIHPEDREKVLHANRTFLDGNEERFSKEFRFRCLNQTYIWIQSRGMVVERNKEGYPLRMIGTHTDITQRKLAEIELAESHAEMVSILNTTLDGYLKTSEQGYVVDSNPAYCRLSGYSRAELFGMHISTLDCNATEIHFANRAQVLVRDGHSQFETRHRRKDGSIWNAEVSATYHSGSRPAMFGFIRNIDDRKKAQRELRRSESTLQATVNAIPDLMYEMDLQGRYYSFHSGDPDLLIISCEEHIGRTMFDILPVAASSSIQCALREANEFGHSFGKEYKLDLRRGTKWFELSMSRKDDAETHEPRFIGLARDITVRKQNELKMVESENQLRAIIEAEPACIKIVDAAGNLMQMNGAGLSMIQADTLDQVLNGPVASLVVPEHRQAFLDMHQRVIAGESRTLEFEIVGLKGRRLWLETSAVPLQFNGANVHLAVTHDITMRKLSETSLRIAAVAFETREGMLISDANNVILRVNSAFSEMTGYSQEEAIGRTPQMLQSGLHDEAFYQKMWEELGRTGAWQGEILDRRKNGEIYPKWLSISAVRDSSGQITHYIGHHTELSQRKKDEAALMATNAELMRSRRELRQLAAQNEHKLEEERRHIAREVHDELGQSLTALRIGMTLLGKRYAQNSPTIVKDIQNLKVLVDRGIQGVRNVATNLRPAALDMGLVPAIQWLCSDFTEHNAIPCELHLLEECIELDDAKSVAIFRIVQEALTNISRYAHATRVDINLGLDGQTLGVEIRDNGCGFNVSISNSKSYGLIGMRERALALNGQIDFISRPGQGTVIGVSIPLDTKHDEMGGT